jgi:glutathione S-transferase
MTPTLWHIELSHYNEKARWALDYKGIEHVRRAPLPGAHNIYAGVLTRGKQRRLPVLRIDGRTVGDSTAIIAALEARQPDPPLYPADPAERARALELEDYFDEQLAPAVRAFAWHHIVRQPGGIGAAIAPTRARRRRFFTATAPIGRLIISADYHATATHADESRVAILAAADRLERELQPSGYLVGDAFSVADLAGAALFTPLLAPPERPYVPGVAPPAVAELREELGQREAGRWVFEMYARHRPASAEVAA